MAGINFNSNAISGNIPWFMFDISNVQLITNILVPSDIIDSKEIVLSETPIPGRNFSPVQYGGGGNRHISFEIPLVKRNNTVGNVLLLKQFDMLRNQAVGLTNIFSQQFRANPKVLYYWGTGSVPLLYYVIKANATHKQNWINALGQPQYSEIQIELVLDEDNALYKVEEVFRRVASITGMIVNTYDLIQSQTSGYKPI